MCACHYKKCNWSLIGWATNKDIVNGVDTLDKVNAIQHNTLQYNTIKYDTIQYNLIWCNMIQYDTIHNVMQFITIKKIKYDTIQHNTT